MAAHHTILATLLAACCCALAATPQEQAAARGVIERFAGSEFAACVSTASCEPKEGCPSAAWKVENNRLQLQGSSGVALCKAFYDFTTSQGAGIASWSGRRFSPPSPLPEGAQAQLNSPVAYHQYFNVVTFGYSTAYWDWVRWEQELDWMALHGINMPLALVATEAISARVFRKLGLSEEEIAAWFTGPAHLPWMRMGNISAHDGPLPQEWHEGQLALQHRILARMRELGMTPICPGFSGFVPRALAQHYPQAQLLETSWGGRFRSWMLSPDDPLFARIGQLFVEEWEKEFGTCTHYLIDSFNEMELPFPPHSSLERYEMLARYGETVYKALCAGSPAATWVMQGWMLGYQRDIWDECTLAALLARVPNEKVLLLDMAVDYNRHFWHNGTNYEKHNGFYGKQWVYSVIPNMGGKTGMTGMLDFYANGHLHALNYPKRQALIGMGMAPEGIENNEVIYELFSDTSWRSTPTELQAWLERYNRNRYGKSCPALMRYWELIRQSAYGSFTDHPRYGWQRRPGSGTKGSINTNEQFYAAIDAFASCAEQYKDSPLYQADLLELTVAAIGGRLEELMAACEAADREGRQAEAENLNGHIVALMHGADRLLCSHPTHRLERWLNFARSHGSTEELQHYYESNARRLVTVWGPPVDDYAAKVWSGLIRSYYLPRWQRYRMFGAAALRRWEEEWVTTCRALSPAQPYKDPLRAAQQLLTYARQAVAQLGQAPKLSAHAYFWSPESFDAATGEWEIALSPSQLRQTLELRFMPDSNSAGIDLESIRLIMDGREVLRLTAPGSGKNIRCTLQAPDHAQGNNECRLIIRARNASGSSGLLELHPTPSHPNEEP